MQASGGLISGLLVNHGFVSTHMQFRAAKSR